MVYFVTEEFIKNETHITQNVDAGDISPYLHISAITYIQPILGYTFYNDILDKFNLGTLNADETQLVEFIKYVVAFYAAYEAVPNLTFRISNKGIQSQSGEFSASESIEVVNYIRRNIVKYAKIKEDELREYLYENKDLFTLYKDKSNKSIVEPDGERNQNKGGMSSI